MQKETSAPVKVIIFEDNKDLRESLMAILNDNTAIECCGAWENCADIEHIVDVYKPDIILMDIEMPVMNGIEGTRVVAKKYPALPVLILTVFEDDKNIFNAICAGASGYLLKSTSPEKLIDSVIDVANGGAPMTSIIAKKVLQFFPKKSSISPEEMYHLSPREVEVIQCLVKGHSYKLVASDLNISIDTVRSHIKHIYEKLHVSSATEAIGKFMNPK